MRKFPHRALILVFLAQSGCEDLDHAGHARSDQTVQVTNTRPVPIAVAHLRRPTGPGQAAALPDAQSRGGERTALTIDDAIQLGLANSFAIARADRNFAQAKQQEKIVQAQRKPRIDLSANAGQGYNYASFSAPGFAPFVSSNPNYYGSIFAYANMPIDLFGQIGRQVQQSAISREQTILQIRLQEFELAASIRLAYLEAMSGDTAKDAARATLGDLRRLRSAAKSRAPEAVPLLDEQISVAEENLAQMQTDTGANLANLKRLLRIPPDVAIQLTSELPATMPDVDYDRLTKYAIENRLDLRSAQNRLRQAELSVRQVKDAMRPTVSIGAFANRNLSGLTPGDGEGRQFDGASVAVNVTIPIARMNGGVLSAQQRIASIAKEQAEADLMEQRERIETEVGNRANEAQAAELRARSGDTSPLREALRDAEAAFFEADPEERPAKLSAVTQAIQAIRAAEVERKAARIGHVTAYYELMRAIGAQSQ